MAALVLADELHEVRMNGSSAATVPAGAIPAPLSDTGVAEALNAVAARIEKIAQLL